VFSALKQIGQYDRTLVIFLSDHGESLGEHGEDEHRLFLYSATSASSFDRQGSARNRADRPPLRALIGARRLYIDAPRPELYDTAKDPGETVDLKAERSAEANAFKARLNHFVRQYTAKAAPAAGAPVPVDTLEKLRSLGYVAYKAPVTTGDGANLPDPKDKIKSHRVILRATALSETGRFPESDRLLRELAPLEPKLYAIPFILGENAFREGHLKEAQRQFLACLNLSPAFSSALIGAARAYHADHQNEKVKPLLQLALQQNRQFPGFLFIGSCRIGRDKLCRGQILF